MRRRRHLAAIGRRGSELRLDGIADIDEQRRRERRRGIPVGAGRNLERRNLLLKRHWFRRGRFVVRPKWDDQKEEKKREKKSTREEREANLLRNNSTVLNSAFAVSSEEYQYCSY